MNKQEQRLMAAELRANRRLYRRLETAAPAALYVEAWTLVNTLHAERSKLADARAMAGR